MSFARSMHSNSARDSASSLTVRTESANALTWANGITPGNATAMPSAIVDIDSARTGCPAANEPGQAAALAACTPMTRTCGARKCTAAAIPAISPPPPVGTTMVATFRICFRISSPTVAWPATMSA